MNFGASAADYRRHRKGFPPLLFDRLPLAGRLLDLGSGTGTLAAGYAERGADVVALDRSGEMLRQAPVAARVVARAEACPFADASFDAVVAGQCWHWFDGPAVARECTRLLAPGGVLAIAHFDYLADAGGVAAASEALILARDPGWAMAGGDGRYERWRPHLEGAGFVDVEAWWEDVAIEYSHEDWRGRMRACNGVLALPDPASRLAFDRELGALLAAQFAEPLVVPHRIFVIRGRIR